MNMAIPTNAIQNVLGYLHEEREHFIGWLFEEHEYVCNVDDEGNISDEELKNAIEELELDSTNHIYVAVLEIEKWLDEIPGTSCYKED